MLSQLSTKFDDHKANVVSELQDIKQSLSFINEKFEEFKSTVEDMKREQQTLKTENNDLRAALESAKTEIVELKQYSRQQNIEIKGLPLRTDEKLADALMQFGKTRGVPISSSDIDVIHRVPGKDKKNPNVIVRLTSRSVRSRILHAVKKISLSPVDFGYEGTDTVYINEHLCPEYKVLLGKAIARKREKGWKFTWVTNGKILARKAENSNVIQIRSEADLALIC